MTRRSTMRPITPTTSGAITSIATKTFTPIPTAVIVSVLQRGAEPGLDVAVALGAIGVAVLFLGVAWFFVKKSRKSLCRDFMERIEDLRQPFADSLAEDYKDGVREFYLEYGGLFEIVRRRIADQRTLLKPRMKRWNNLFLEIKAIEQEL